MNAAELLAFAEAIAKSNGHPAPAEWAAAVASNYHVAPEEPQAPPVPPEGG